ncbi:MAG: FG-GAP-like repeat-containing protein, partial [Patescibacteria group bacterium]
PSVFAADFDNDGDSDLVTANYYGASISILLNNGDGTFVAAVNYSAGGGAWSVFAADLDSDGDNDLAVADYNNGRVSILLNTVIQIYTYTLNLTDSQGMPIANARVNLRRSDNSYVTYAMTNSAGQAAFKVAPDACMKLEVDYNGAKYSTETSCISEDLEVDVQTSAFGLGFLDSNNNPIANARVNLRRSDNSYVTYAMTNSGGVATFQVVPNATMKLEVDYNGGKYSTDPTTISENTELPVQAVSLNVHVTAAGNDLIGQRVDLLSSGGSYVTYIKTDGAGTVTFQIVPDAQHKVRSTYNGVTWTSEGTAGPIDLEYNF